MTIQQKTFASNSVKTNHARGPASLKTEYAANPLGIDAPPRFSWCYDGLGTQKSYRILAASSENLLQHDQADLWDSGRVASPDSQFIPYGGKILSSGQRVYWQVQSWNKKEQKHVSGTAWFEMGLLRREDWQGVFISIPGCCTGGRGYHSKVLESGEAPAVFWVQVDLEKPESFEQIVIHPCYYREQGEELGPGFGFPVQFRVETSATPDFRQSAVVYKTSHAVPNPGLKPFEISLPGKITARYVRLSVIEPFSVGGRRLLALDEIQVFSGESNLALRKPCSAANYLAATIPAGGSDWSVQCLTDGVIHVNEPRTCQVKGNLVRRILRLTRSVKSARAYIAARGWCEMKINGTKVGDAALDTAWTVFDRRLLYSTWDVTELLANGDNVVTLLLGSGWASDPAFILQVNVEHTDGTRSTLVSDGEWRLLPSPVRENNVYHGETCDARQENHLIDTPAFDDSSFPFAPVAKGYAPALSAQMQPPIRVTETLPAVNLTEPQPGVWVYDLGQNIAGWARLRVHGEKGREIKLRFAETIFDDGSVWTDAEQTKARREGKLKVFDGMINNANYRNVRAIDRYICKGSKEDEFWEPRFTYHGFRFVELTGYPGAPDLHTITGRAVHTDVHPVSSFECSHPVLNWTFTAARRTFSNNIHSVFTDCCQRDERQGWGGDAHETCEAILLSLDTAAAYIKWLQDSRDSQRNDGALGDTVPYSLGRMGGDVAWGCTWALIAWYVYLYTGDWRVLEQQFDATRRYLEFLERTYPEYFADNANYGDWLALEETPRAVVENAFWFETARVAARCAVVLGRDAEQQRWDKVARKIADEFHRRLFNAQKGEYGTGSQTSNVLPLRFGIVPEELRPTVFAKLVANIEKRGRHLSTGIHGAKHLLEVLCEFGRPDLALAIAGTEKFPGLGYMRARGATTIWEHWKLLTGRGMNSHDHPTFGSLVSWLMKCLAGIRPDPAAPGFRRILLRPEFPDGLDYARGELQTVRGIIRSGWRRAGENIRLEIRIPDGCSAALRVRSAGGIWKGREKLSETGEACLGPGEVQLTVKPAAGNVRKAKREVFPIYE